MGHKFFFLLGADIDTCKKISAKIASKLVIAKSELAKEYRTFQGYTGKGNVHSLEGYSSLNLSGLE